VDLETELRQLRPQPTATIRLAIAPAVVTVHRGPYNGLTDTYNALAAWMEANGHEQGGAPWEVYLTDPGETRDPADYRTEVYWPVR